MADLLNPALSKVLKYQNKHVVHRFSMIYGLTNRQSKLIFTDMLRFLWLTNRIKFLNYKRLGVIGAVANLSMIDSWHIIDEMWHCFVLFSSDYEAFGRKYFGRTLNHMPDVSSYHHPKGDRPQVNIDAYVDLIYDEFGSAVANRWFDTYRKKYTKKKILLLQLKALTHL